MWVSQISICIMQESIDFRILLVLETTSDCVIKQKNDVFPNVVKIVISVFKRGNFVMQVAVHKNISRRTALEVAVLLWIFFFRKLQ